MTCHFFKAEVFVRQDAAFYKSNPQPSKEITMQNKEYLRAAATAIARQIEENPVVLGVPLDPDVADYLGAFVEEAITLADIVEDGLLTVNNSGEVVYVE